MPKRSTFDWILEGLAIVALAVVIGTVAVNWTELPERVPRHFGASGRPDGWGNRNGMLVIPLTAAGLYILLTIASRYQRLINIPIAMDRNDPEVRRILQSLSIALKTVLLFLFAYLEWAMVNTALGRSQGLGTLFLPIFLAAIFLPLGFYLHKLRGHQV